MTVKRTISLIGIIALVAVIGSLMAACGDGGGGGGGSGGGGGGGGGSSGSAFLGETMTLSGQVYNVRQGGTPQKPSINYDKFNGNLTIMSSYIGGSGEIKNGQFSYTIGTPTTLVSLSSYVNIYFFDYDNVTYSNSNTQGMLLSGFPVSSGSYDYTLARLNISVSGNSGTFEYVYYVYVDKDITISGKGKTTDDEDGKFITKNFNLALKAGWNAMYMKTTVTNKTYTETISLSNPSLKWVLLDPEEEEEDDDDYDDYD